MSTNYYFYKKEDNLEEVIHIGKRSVGWEPLFERTKYFNSVVEIKEYFYNNQHNLLIKDEYGNLLSFDELETELINWNKDNALIQKHCHDSSDDFYSDSEGYAFANFEFS